MAKKKSRSSRVSMGGRSKANKAHEAKRQAKFAAKRENGTAYEYKPNPYDKKTQFEQWAEENANRIDKTKGHKLPLARLTSIMRKLQNELDDKKLYDKEQLAKKKK